MAAKTKKETAAATHALKSRAAPIIERAPLPIVEVQGKTHIVSYVNSAFCLLLGKPRGELIGKPFTQIVHGGEKCAPILDRVYQTGQAATLAQEDPSEPTPAYWLYAMWPALDAKQRPVGVIIQMTKAANFREKAAAVNEALLISGLRQHELTEVAEKLNVQLQAQIIERNQAEAALREAKDRLADRAGELERIVAERTGELTASTKQLESFIYTIAHDLRGPLRAMQGFSQLLVEEAGDSLSRTGLGLAQRIDQSAQFMDALLRDLLAFSQLSLAAVELEPINLESCVKAVVARLADEIHEKKARLELKPPWPAALGHAPTLGQVLTNLVSNALKFVAPGAPPIVKIWAEDRKDPPTVRVWVEDHGIGIAQAHQEQIFRPFSRLESGSFPGTGIGLAIVQKGVERMHGRCGVESKPGSGSRFWFELRKAE